MAVEVAQLALPPYVNRQKSFPRAYKLPNTASLANPFFYYNLRHPPQLLMAIQNPQIMWTPYSSRIDQAIQYLA